MLPEEGKLGPAMKRLNDRQRLFVLACLELGCETNHTKAAAIAGYSGNPDTMKVTAHRLAHDEKVQAALLEEAKRRVQAGTMGATALLVQTVGDETIDRKVRLKAAVEVLDRGGLHAVREVRAPDGGGEGGRTEKLLRLAVLAKMLGQDPKALLGNLADVVPADLRVVGGEDVSGAAADAELTLPEPAPGSDAQPAAPLLENP